MADQIRTFQMSMIELANGVSSDELSFKDLLADYEGQTLAEMMAEEVGAAEDAVFCVDGREVDGDTVIDEDFEVKERIMAVKSAGRKG